MPEDSILAGYMGILDLDGSKVRVNSFNVNVEQTPLYYDHSIGLRDSIVSTIYSTKGDTGFKGTPQKNIYRPSVIGVTGSTSFPVQERTENKFFENAKTGDDFDITYARDCQNTVKYTGCKITQYQLNMSAGDIPNVSVSIMGLSAEEVEAAEAYEATTKLLTWDTCKVEVPGMNSDMILSFSMSINNECKYIYTAGFNEKRELRPAKIRVGLQSVTGTISFYKKGMALKYMETQASGEQVLQVTMGELSFGLNCVYVPVKREGQPGPIVSTLGFYGVGSYWV